MESTKQQFKDALTSNYIKKLTGPDSSEIMKDLSKYSKEMKEDLEGGVADEKTLLDLAMKHSFKNKVLTTSHKIESLLGTLKSELKKGITIEMEHTNDEKTAREIAMDHLYEDPHYYSKLIRMEKKHKLDKPIGKIFTSQKSETKEDLKTSAKKEFAKDLQQDKDYLEFKKNAKKKEGYKEFNFGVPNVTSDDPYIKKRKWSRPGKEEATEATTTGSSGAFSAPLFGGEGDDQFIKKSQKETPKLDEGLATGAMGIDKVEAKEATGSGSVGGYESPAMWAKSTSKKDWGPSRKTQYKGGSFVKVKKKCTRFPYCNQGDINALKITKNESVKEAIKKVSKKLKISEQVIKNILEYEFSKIKR